MPSPRALQRRLRFLKQTRQMTEAMRLIAQVKLRRLREYLDDLSPSEIVLEEMLAMYFAAERELRHEPILTAKNWLKEKLAIPLKNEADAKPCLMILGGARGFAGDYYEAMRQFIRNDESGYLLSCDWLPVGARTQQIATSFHKEAAELITLSEKPSAIEMDYLHSRIMEGLRSGRWSDMQILSYRYEGGMRQVLQSMPFLEVQNPPNLAISGLMAEPDLQTVGREIIERCLYMRLQRAVLATRLCEEQLRVRAMTVAGDNATERITDLDRRLKRARQDRITQSLIESSSTIED